MLPNGELIPCIFTAIPLLDLFRVYVMNLCTYRNQERREYFANSQDDLVRAWCVVGIKVGNIVILFFATALLMTMLYFFHME